MALDLRSQQTAFEDLVRRLSRQSVDKRHEAFVDVDWEADDQRIDPADRRFELWDLDPLGATEWYRSQPAEVRARIGLVRMATTMRTGWEFENILQRGLLAFAFRLPNGRPEFRYLHHEVTEESQHTLMFQEFVDRSGLPVAGLAPPLKQVAEIGVLPLAHLFPELFFLFVLGGEDPIDHVQRTRLRHGEAHPLAERIMRIHVTEEARHLSFARHYLTSRVPDLGRARRLVLSVAAPVLLGVMARQMIQPGGTFGRVAGVPRAVLREARRSEQSRTVVRDSVGKVRRLCTDLGLVNPLSRPLWRLFGISDPGPGAAR
ncbi:MAG: AurF N-oxygenase family protein [Acidimicrobiales bacterium]